MPEPTAISASAWRVAGDDLVGGRDVGDRLVQHHLVDRAERPHDAAAERLPGVRDRRPARVGRRGPAPRSARPPGHRAKARSPPAGSAEEHPALPSGRRQRPASRSSIEGASGMRRHLPGARGARQGLDRRRHCRHSRHERPWMPADDPTRDPALRDRRARRRGLPRAGRAAGAHRLRRDDRPTGRDRPRPRRRRHDRLRRDLVQLPDLRRRASRAPRDELSRPARRRPALARARPRSFTS